MGRLLLLVIASASIAATIGFAVPPKMHSHSHFRHRRQRTRTVLETNDSLGDPFAVLLTDIDEAFILQLTPAESPLPVSFDPSPGKVVEAEVGAPMPPPVSFDPSAGKEAMPPMTAASLTKRAVEMKAQLAKSSRPKKYTISTHSAFSTIVTAIFFAAVLPHLSPGTHGNGLPRLYDMADFDNAFLAKTTGLMFAISAVTGVLRLPPRSTKLRRLMFESCAWSTVLMFTLQDSNIFLIDGGYDLDLFQGPGWFVAFVVFVGTVISTLEYLVEGIAGPEDGRIRDGLPFAGNRLGMAFVSTFAYFGISPMSLTIPPWFFDRDPSAFAEIVVPGLHMVSGWNLSVNFIVEAYMGFGSEYGMPFISLFSLVTLICSHSGQNIMTCLHIRSARKHPSIREEAKPEPSRGPTARRLFRDRSL